ncbi:MAG: TetR/AcrR family transcriptional regulator [Atopobiaceae bacterium]|jgi:AcrR family transcriptional regulator|nr:TetR/AcrR family transcriptional regulator [Atopobiaceae bacterium]MCI2173349.1 TetR/AcrR family transcriptional regulator [Atopobiaceae bacterium]MCI2207344.1 TetR/AcrR family transcriptional regulator [Atopobiaceae bacterium]
MALTLNRNALRSIRLLKEAFLRLIVEKPYEQISVSDVTREADLNRGTFYAHFDNMDDLLRSTMDDLSEGISRLMDQALDEGFLTDPMPVLERISGYLGNDQVLYQKIISSTSVEPFINSLREMFRDKMREYLAREGGGTDERYDLVSTEYLTSGVLGVYRSWLTGDFGDATADDVNRYLCGLVKVTCRAVRP